MWKPREIIVNSVVIDDPVTRHILSQCPDVPVGIVDSGRAEDVKKKSRILSSFAGSMLDQIIAGKGVLYIAPPGQAVDVFNMPDDRVVCPDFDRLKLASNGCYYQCDWCYLKLTYRAAFPFITVRVGYKKIKDQLKRKLQQSDRDIIFNCGELADSLAMEHLTRAGQEFIPWFGKSRNGYLFMLTKSDNVDDLLDLDHNGHTAIAFSLNAPEISRKFEIGAPSFTRRLEAARKVQEAGYPLRIRLDPIVPVDGWREMYADVVKRIFDVVTPERITLGTLRFEEQFYRMRHNFFTTGPELQVIMENMTPMFEPRLTGKSKKPKVGKYSFAADKRAEIFGFVLGEIRKYSHTKIALCKESEDVWRRVGLDVSRCSCVCQMA